MSNAMYDEQLSILRRVYSERITTALAREDGASAERLGRSYDRKSARLRGLRRGPVVVSDMRGRTRRLITSATA